MLVKRIIADGVLCLSIFFLPWWVTLVLSTLFFFFFDQFYELLIAAYLTDLLFGVRLERFLGFPFLMTLVASALFVLLLSLRERMRL